MMLWPGCAMRGLRRTILLWMLSPAIVCVRAQTVTAVASPLNSAAPISSTASSAAVDENVSSSTISEEKLEQLPTNTLEWNALALRMETANEAIEGDGGSSALVSYRGFGATQNGSLIDGVSDDQSFRSGARGQAGGGSRAEYTFTAEAVREFRVNTHNFGAQYGNAVGGVVNTVSRSGGNELHGSGMYLLRASAMAATNPFTVATHYVDGVVTSALVKPHDLRQQAGATIGGAIRHDRLFYFYAYDQHRRNFPGVSAPLYAGFYTLSPMQTALLGNRGVSVAKINTALNYLNSLTGTVARRADQTVNFGKLDWQRTARERLSVQYNRARSSSPAGVATGPVVARGAASFGNTYLKVDAAVGRWTRQITPHVSEELRVQVGRDFEYELAQPPLAQEPAIGPGGFAPQVSIEDPSFTDTSEATAEFGSTTGFVYGTPSALGRQAYPDERRVQIVEALTWVHGRHAVTIGMDFNRVHDFVNSLANAEGSFFYDSGITGGYAGGLVDWITDYTFNVNAYPNGGCPCITASVHNFCFREFTQSFGAAAVRFNTQEWSGYVQETWRPMQHLTVNAGLRGEYELLPLPQRPNAALDMAFAGVGATSAFPEDRNNFGPRVGVAWSPPKLHGAVVRAGYGLYFGRLPGATVRSALIDTALASSTTHVRITPSTVTDCPQVTGVNQGFGYPCTFVTQPPQAVEQTTSAMLFDRRFRLPVVQQGELTLEQSMGLGIMASASYLLDMGTQLPNSVDVNIAPSNAFTEFVLQGSDGRGVQNGATFVVPVYSERVNANFGPVTDVVSNVNAAYNAMVLEARRKTLRGLEFHASWTWAKAIDYGQNSGATPRTNAQFDPFNVRYDRGLSSLNVPHKLVLSGVWEPRFGGGRVFGRGRLANGWSVSGIFTENSGRPYSYQIFGGTRLAGGRETINGAGGATYLPTVGRNTLRMPDTVNMDLRLGRAFGLQGFHRDVTLRVFAEGFNVLNHENISAVQQRAFVLGPVTNGMTPLIFQDAAAVAAEGLNTQPFGTVTAAGTSARRERQVELGIKLEF